MLVDPFHGRRTGCFVLQWHLTQACDLACAHCYDREPRSVLPRAAALELLDDFVGFCRRRDVSGRVTFSGGNPFFYPAFFEVYAAAVQRSLPPAILGNPVDETALERLVAIRAPDFFQVSLEGLRAHNDAIRGEGAFDRVLDFLPRLRARGIRAVVMCTLTAENMAQILPLGERLRGLADRLTFNRLSQTGSGAALALPDAAAYADFLRQYDRAQRDNPVLGPKDGLLNILRYRDGRPLFGGCTGHGCGAAFNSFAVLPGGEAHACRKLPSPIGDVVKSGFDAVYDSEAARRYRRGCRGCDGCAIRARCGGCMAVTAGQGGDPFRDTDPFCGALLGRPARTASG